MHRLLGPAAALCLTILTSSANAQPATYGPYATPQQRVEVAPGRFIHVICMGEGSPTVVLSAGADGWSADWRLVQLAITKKTRVCGWDRAGHGFSSGSPEPQDVAHTEADLEKALSRAGVTGPLVLVAHSLGAFETFLFADRHPEQVAGMVLVDPSAPDQAERLPQAAPALMAWSAASDEAFFQVIRGCIAALKAGGSDPSPDCNRLRSRYPEPLRTNLLTVQNDPAYWESFLSLFQSQKVSSKLAINPKRNYGSMPLVVLDAGRFAFPSAPAEAQRDAPAAQAQIKADHEAMARLSTRGAFTPVPDSAHAVALQKPQVVIDAVAKVVDEVRAGPPRR